jgi:glycosyltransferase involved in cell wall biosynthesis
VRIVYLHQYFLTPEMAGGTRSYEWASRLAERGHEVHVVTSFTGRGDPPTPSPTAQFQVHWIPVPYDNAMSPQRRLLAFLQFAARSARRARALDPDLVFATSTPLTIALPALAAIWKRSTPMVFEVRDLWPEVPIAMGALRNPVLRAAARALERLAYRHATRIVALSEEMAAGVASTGFPRAAIAMVPNAADTALFRREGLDAAADEFRRSHDWLGGRPLVLYAGTLGRANDVPVLARIAAECEARMPELRFLVVGNGAEEESVRAAARQLGVLDRTFFMLPPQPKESVPTLLAAATVTASLFADLPALRANSPNKVFDSLAAGRPVVVNNEGSLSDLLEASGAGIVLPRDPAAAARELTGFLADAGRLSRAREAAAELGAGRFSRDSLFGVFVRTLEQAHDEGRVVRRLRRVGSDSRDGR